MYQSSPRCNLKFFDSGVKYSKSHNSNINGQCYVSGQGTEHCYALLIGAKYNFQLFRIKTYVMLVTFWIINKFRNWILIFFRRQLFINCRFWEVYRYQRGYQNPYIAKDRVKKDKQWSAWRCTENKRLSSTNPTENQGWTKVIYFPEHLLDSIKK
jgi:hypothetical protein